VLGGQRHLCRLVNLRSWCERADRGLVGGGENHGYEIMVVYVCGYLEFDVAEEKSASMLSSLA